MKLIVFHNQDAGVNVLNGKDGYSGCNLDFLRMSKCFNNTGRRWSLIQKLIISVIIDLFLDISH